jgi:hypothetical protein
MGYCELYGAIRNKLVTSGSPARRSWKKPEKSKDALQQEKSRILRRSLGTADDRIREVLAKLRHRFGRERKDGRAIDDIVRPKQLWLDILGEIAEPRADDTTSSTIARSSRSSASTSTSTTITRTTARLSMLRSASPDQTCCQALRRCLPT